MVHVADMTGILWGAWHLFTLKGINYSYHRNDPIFAWYVQIAAKSRECCHCCLDSNPRPRTQHNVASARAMEGVNLVLLERVDDSFDLKTVGRFRWITLFVQLLFALRTLSHVRPFALAGNTDVIYKKKWYRFICRNISSSMDGSVALFCVCVRRAFYTEARTHTIATSYLQRLLTPLQFNCFKIFKCIIVRYVSFISLTTQFRLSGSFLCHTHANL